jgi:hypothetical protein
MASRGGSLGRSHTAEERKKPPIPSFTKPKQKTEASKDANKEHATDKIDDTKSEGSNNSEGTHHNNTTSTTHRPPKPKTEGKGDTQDADKTKPEAPKKPIIKAIVIPSRYMAKASPRLSNAQDKKPASTPKPTTSTTTGLRTKTPERSTDRRDLSKTPTKPSMITNTQVVKWFY